MTKTAKIEIDAVIHEIPIYRGAYPLGDMEIGESFTVPDPLNRSSLTNSINYAARRFNIKFTTRKIDGGVRVWRIK